MNTMIMPTPSHAAEQSLARTILIVDDEAMVRMPISEYLRDCGYTVLEAADASEAIATIDSDQIHVVFSDIRMPGSMDGFGLAKWLRAHHPEIPVILTSGYHGGKALDTIPGVRFIEKPYSQANVERRIAALLAH